MGFNMTINQAKRIADQNGCDLEWNKYLRLWTIYKKVTGDLVEYVPSQFLKSMDEKKFVELYVGV